MYKLLFDRKFLLGERFRNWLVFCLFFCWLLLVLPWFLSNQINVLMIEFLSNTCFVLFEIAVYSVINPYRHLCIEIYGQQKLQILKSIYLIKELKFCSGLLKKWMIRFLFCVCKFPKISSYHTNVSFYQHLRTILFGRHGRSSNRFEQPAYSRRNLEKSTSARTYDSKTSRHWNHRSKILNDTTRHVIS